MNVVVLDNLRNSSCKSLAVVEQLTGQSVTFYEGDIRDAALLRQIFGAERIDHVIHFAGLKAVGESSQILLEYYDNNIAGTVNLLQVMAEFDCKNTIFGSSAAAYDHQRLFLNI